MHLHRLFITTRTCHGQCVRVRSGYVRPSELLTPKSKWHKLKRKVTSLAPILIAILILSLVLSLSLLHSLCTPLFPPPLQMLFIPVMASIAVTTNCKDVAYAFYYYSYLESLHLNSLLKLKTRSICIPANAK